MNHIISMVFFAGYYDDDVFAWDYIDSGNPYNTYASPGNLDIEMICVYDDNYTGITEPEDLTYFLPEAGQAIFRSSWEEDAVYMCLLGEYGIAREGGRAHEHPDNMSFIIYAYGELLAMDSGYLSYDQHDLVRYAKNHSLILVDGEGPSAASTAAANGTDALIANYFDTPFIDYAEVLTLYEDAYFMRCVSFIHNNYFIISDYVYSDASHTYDWLLHGNGGGNTGNDFVLTANGSKYSVNGVDLNFFINSSSAITLSSYDDYHEGGYNIADEHTVTQASITTGDFVLFSSFLMPAQSTRDFVYTPINLGDCIGGTIAEDNKEALSLVKYNSDLVTTDFLGMEVGFDGYSLNISRLSGEIPSVFFLKDGHNVDYDDVDIITCSDTTNITLNIGSDLANGYISTGCTVQFFTGNPPANVIGATSWSYPGGGVLTAIFPDDTYFEIEVEWSLINLSSDNNAVSSVPILHQNYPNPFNPETTISFEMPLNIENPVIEIYNIKGEKIKTLCAFPNGSLGTRCVVWDGKDDMNKPVASGIYFYKMQAGKYSSTRKMLLMK